MTAAVDIVLISVIFNSMGRKIISVAPAVRDRTHTQAIRLRITVVYVYRSFRADSGDLRPKDGASIKTALTIRLCEPPRLAKLCTRTQGRHPRCWWRDAINDRTRHHSLRYVAVRSPVFLPIVPTSALHGQRLVCSRSENDLALGAGGNTVIKMLPAGSIR